MRLALLDDYQDVARSMAAWESLAGVEITAFHDHLADDDAIAARLEPFDIIVAMRERTAFPATLLARLPRLRLLVTTGARNASIDVAAATTKGIVVCGTRGESSPAAELAWALVLALARSIPLEDASLRSGGWQHTVGLDLNGATLGVIGLGRLGGRVAGYGVAFGMRVISWSPNLTAARAAEVGATLVSRDQLLRTSDMVSIHLVLGARSRGLIGDRELGLMKPTAYLVNTSRGPIVDEGALIRALHENRIAGAGLDVFDDEPLAPGHPLRQAPHTVLTPHLGYVTRNGYRTFYGDALEDVRAYLDGAPIRVVKD